MKIQCDVCTKHHATLFCSADEAALCDGCDHRVHHANTLASKHQRFSLTYPSTNHHLPLCDVCQERRGFVFCQEDRAILCRECDVPIHSANELTKNHNRFLLTGIKFSATATATATSTATAMPYSQSPPNRNHSAETNEQVGSSISEYLINTIPGMKFEDFLDSHTLPFPYSNNGDEMFGKGNMVSFSCGGMWVPEEQNGMAKDGFGNSFGLGDDNFIVPQLNPPPPPNNVYKRSRLHW